jgi:ribulose-phosphate 3-epimerase
MPAADELVSRLRTKTPAVLPSLLLCDFGNLEQDIRHLERAGVAALHLDVMDGQFVPNLTYGMPIVEACNRLTELPLDVHLMIAQPQRYLKAFRDAGADLMTIHIEAVEEPGAALAEIRKLGALAGLALNPDTPLDRVTPYLDACDLVLVMSVPAGFGGQKFHPVALEKLRSLRELAGDRLLLGIDGGVSASTIRQCTAAGAELLVVGSAIFGQPNYETAVRELGALARHTSEH